MKRDITASSVIGKAVNAYAQARRCDPALPKPVSGEGKAVTLGGKLCAILPTQDGGLMGYAVEPTYRLVKLSNAQLAPYRHHVPAATPHERLKRLVGMVLDQLAVIEEAADCAHAEARRNGHANGGGNGNAPAPVGIHLAAE
jgi:hypothetical protein